jgi:tetratricopeptide (TPR) repeat protein
MTTGLGMKLRLLMLFVAALMGLSRATAQEMEMHSHPPPEKLGTVVFPTTCTKKVAPDFERALALLHSFAYTASEAAFQKVASADPGCAMAYWGVAMSYFHQLWSPPGRAELLKGQQAIGEAIRLKGHSQRERGFIAAAAAYYHDSDHVPHALRAKAYVDAMAILARDNPTDTEAQVFYALSLIGTAPPEDKSHANQKRAAAILEPIYREHPDHPGIAHYLIHAYDSAELAPRGLAAARAYAKIAPSAPHALHMPSHIFTRLGLWDDSISSNLAARAAAHAQADKGEELHAMDYLVYAYLQRGRQADAQLVVKSLAAMEPLQSSDFKVGYAATAMPVRLQMETQNWAAAATLQPLPDSAPHVAAIVFWARAVANSRAGRPQVATADIARLDDCQHTLQATGNSYWAKQVDVLRKEAAAWQWVANVRTEEAIALLEQAADEEDSLEKLPVTPGPIIPAREQLGDLLLKSHRPDQALRAYRDALAGAPGRRGALVGAINAADLVGDTQTASHMRAVLMD